MAGYLLPPSDNR